LITADFPAPGMMKIIRRAIRIAARFSYDLLTNTF
jgi:hypothetical protein